MVLLYFLIEDVFCPLLSRSVLVYGSYFRSSLVDYESGNYKKKIWAFGNWNIYFYSTGGRLHYVSPFELTAKCVHHFRHYPGYKNPSIESVESTIIISTQTSSIVWSILSLFSRRWNIYFILSSMPSILLSDMTFPSSIFFIFRTCLSHCQMD